METVKEKLSGRKGEFALHGAVILVVFMLLLMMALETFHVYTTVSSVKKKTNEAVLATAALNVSGIYQGVRQSDWNARQYSDTFWASNVDVSQVIQHLAQSTGSQLTEPNGLLKKKSYLIMNLVTTYINETGGCLNFTTTFKLEIFLSIGGIINTAIPFDLEVQTSYAQKF